MASSKRPEKPKERAVPRLYSEEGDEGTGALSPAVTLPVQTPRSSSRVEVVPETVRVLDESESTDEIPRSNDSEVPDLADEDGTHTDKTALMMDRSLRQGDRPTLTILTGASAGLVFSLEKLPVTIGRTAGVEVLLRDAGVSRKHARVISPTPGLYVLEDLESTNGIRVNGVRSNRCELRAGDRIQLGPEVVIQFAYLDDAEENLTKQLYVAATRDPLTLALNRRTFDERLASEFSYARRRKTRLSVILFDIDHFKSVNDKHGHIAGDMVLREVAQAVRRTIRSEDVFARYGGEEFALVVRGETCEETAMFAERLRAAVSAAETKPKGSPLKVTISLGVAELSECDADVRAEALVALADQRLYRAKELGRNRVCATSK